MFCNILFFTNWPTFSHTFIVYSTKPFLFFLNTAFLKRNLKKKKQIKKKKRQKKKTKQKKNGKKKKAHLPLIELLQPKVCSSLPIWLAIYT